MLQLLSLNQPEVWQPRIPGPCSTPWANRQTGKRSVSWKQLNVVTLFPNQTIIGLPYFGGKWSLWAFAPIQGNVVPEWVRPTPVVTERNINWLLFMVKIIDFLHHATLNPPSSPRLAHLLHTLIQLWIIDYNNDLWCSEGRLPLYFLFTSFLSPFWKLPRGKILTGCQRGKRRFLNL